MSNTLEVGLHTNCHPRTLPQTRRGTRTYLGLVFDSVQNVGQEGVRSQRAVEGDDTSHKRPEDHQNVKVPYKKQGKKTFPFTSVRTSAFLSTGRATARSGRTATARLTAPRPSPRPDYRLRSRVAAASPSSKQQKSGYCRQVSRRASAPRTRCRSLSPAARSQPMAPPSRLPASGGGRAASAGGGTWRDRGRRHGRHLVDGGGGGSCASRPAQVCARRSAPPRSHRAYGIETERLVWNVVYCCWGRLQAIFTLITALWCGASHEFPRCLNVLVSTVVIPALEAPSYDCSWGKIAHIRRLSSCSREITAGRASGLQLWESLFSQKHLLSSELSWEAGVAFYMVYNPYGHI